MELAPTSCNGGVSPSLVHWHLRKCGGTTIREALVRHPAYIEAHTGFWGVLAEERRHKVAPRPGCSTPQRFVVLREPYSQLISEMDHFPWSFVFSRNKTVYTAADRIHVTPNHLVCGQSAQLGLCNRRGQCNATEVLEMIDTQIDYVGFFEHLDVTFRALGEWFTCWDELHRPEALAPAPAAAGAPAGRANLTWASLRRNMEWSLRQAAARFNRTSHERATRLTDADGIAARLADGHMRFRDNASRDAAHFVLQRAPARATDFEAEHACAIEVHRRAVARYGTGAPTARALHRVAAAEPVCVVGVDQLGGTTSGGGARNV